MNIRLRAVIYTVGMFAAVAAGAFAVVALATFVSVDPTVIFSVLISVFLVWTVYGLMLSKLKMDDEIDAIDRRIEERSK
jgi:membrane protein implicated in regulation of membrane protease activity